MTTNPAEIARKLSEAQRRAVCRSGLPKVVRAGDLFPGHGHAVAQGWLRETPLFERYFHGGYMAYRLTDLGLAVRAILEEQKDA